MRTITRDTIDCPDCHHRLEYFVSLAPAVNPTAAHVETKGPRIGQPFHVVAECFACGASFEVESA